MNSQPTLLIEAVRTVLILLTAFGLAITADQQAAIIAAAGVIAALVSAGLAWWNRSKVYSPETTQKIANAATYQAAGTIVDIGVPPEGK